MIMVFKEPSQKFNMELFQIIHTEMSKFSVSPLPTELETQNRLNLNQNT